MKAVVMILEQINAWSPTIALAISLLSLGVSAFVAFLVWFGRGIKLKLSYAIDTYASVEDSKPGSREKRHLTIIVTNSGDVATIINRLTLEYSPSFWGNLLNAKPKILFVARATPFNDLPYTLNAGSVWRIAYEQTENADKILNTCRVWACVYTNCKNKPAGRIRIKRR
ncbi:MAG: hypothetical protein MJE68_01990 [Proteobacteria bacterium]|nr:hypothetical protein [Pseudomonadota bacterium]